MVSVAAVHVTGVQVYSGSIPRGGGELGQGFAGYVPLVSQNPHPILVTFGHMSL